MKKFTLMLMALLAFAGSMNAKSFETTLWEDTYTEAIELNAETVATFNEGNVLRIYITVPAGGANFSLSYKSEGNGWTDTAIPSVGNMWPWVNGGNTYYDVTLTAADITALDGQNIYITKGDNSTITKVVLTGEIAPTSETELLDAAWTASWTAKTFDAQGGAKIGDVIRVQYTAYKDDATDWPWVQFYFMDGSGNNLVDPVAASKQKNAVTVFDYEIESLDALSKIQTGGFSIKGDQFVLNSVKLLTYADSYDAVSVTIGADELATFSCSKNLDFTDTGIKAYYASAVAEGTVTMTETATTWNYCGYILKGSAGTYTVKVVDDEHASYPSPNYLKGQVSAGTVAASTAGTYHYIFDKNASSQIGFFKLTADYNLDANMAYLETAEDIAPTPGACVTLIFDGGETTSISEKLKVRSEKFATAKDCYDLMGRKVAQPTRGLYIVNGKKVVIK